MVFGSVSFSLKESIGCLSGLFHIVVIRQRISKRFGYLKTPNNLGTPKIPSKVPTVRAKQQAGGPLRDGSIHNSPSLIRNT
jgi:hypothetical protein